MSTSSPATVDPYALVRRMVPFAIDSLPALQLPSGLYCYDTAYEDRSRLRGESVRYSLMVLLGLQRAASAGSDVSGIDDLWQVCLRNRSLFSPGDYGLALWADRQQDGCARADLLRALDDLLADRQRLAPLVGMEIGWLAVGLAGPAAAGDARALDLLDAVVAELARRRARSGLYRHHGGIGLRSRLPNFATEIYTLLALVALAQHDLDPSAREHAEVLGDQLLRLQMEDGGWPWLFDAERGRVVERYEIYSVHQDAMAPMALIALSELTGNPHYLRAAVRGLAWSHGHNELGVDLFDEGGGFAHRSIRRRPPWSRLALACNSAGSLGTGASILDRSPVELNRTCRPYHLGWILEAWAGREELATEKSDS